MVQIKIKTVWVEFIKALPCTSLIDVAKVEELSEPELTDHAGNATISVIYVYWCFIGFLVA